MTEQVEKVEDILELEGLTLRKKKKKKKEFNLEDLDKALNDTGDAPASGETGTEAIQEADPEVNQVDDIGDDLNFDFAKKKKKKKKIITFDEETDKPNDENVDQGAGDGADNDGIGFGESEGATTEGSNWLGTDRDYTYEELIEHVFNIIRANNPELNAGEKKRFVMKPPTVLRVGTKKTSFANFLEICKLVHRQPKHMQAFLLAELGTSGSVDANNQLIIKGRFLQKQIENVLRRYIKEYVACQTCRSPNTILQKETRLFFLQCEKCGSRRSVSSIKSGFQAVTSKRAAIRAKTN
ncbi:Eukaryotic translation initiation factor 2 subunit 2, partial [Fragariocoptes setiger]